EVLPLGQIVADTFPDLAGSVMPVTALTGEGVLDGLQKVVRAILQNLGQHASGTAEEADEELTFADKPAQAVSPVSAGVSSEGFSVESAGEPVMLEEGILSVPLRLLDAAGVCKAQFRLGITVLP
ncbi:MAG TPA: hypothetical protein VFF53_08335, partial [Geobacteraceae bacterium]|nr:hypothetical protein [Geobacteraceae bacterium]